MKKFNFSNEGFQNLQKHLYQKNDQQLETEACYLLADFRKWVIRKFILSDEQIAFINSQNPTIIRLLAVQTFIAISNRLPITLAKPATKPNAQQLDSKLIRPESNFTTLFDGNGSTKISGSLIIHISYITKSNQDFRSNAYQKPNQQHPNQTSLTVFSNAIKQL